MDRAVRESFQRSSDERPYSFDVNRQSSTRIRGQLRPIGVERLEQQSQEHRDLAYVDMQNEVETHKRKRLKVNPSAFSLVRRRSFIADDL
jgi:hypothetical protein